MSRDWKKNLRKKTNGKYAWWRTCMKNLHDEEQRDRQTDRRTDQHKSLTCAYLIRIESIAFTFDIFWIEMYWYAKKKNLTMFLNLFLGNRNSVDFKQIERESWDLHFTT